MIGQLSPLLILSVIAAYFAMLVGVSFLTSKKADSAEFFLGNKQSPWPLVALGMIGSTLSGVTFISIPGTVGAGGLNQAFSYMQVVFGYLLGYLFIATVLLPLYYRLGLTSIYQFLEERLGRLSYRTGAFYFMLSRVIGASFRMFLVAIVLQRFVADAYGVPFWLTVLITVVLIWLYTFRGGIKTIIYTDTIQTVCMVLAVAFTVYSIGSALDVGVGGLIDLIQKSDYSQVFFFEGGWTDPNNFFKQFFSGALITIVMTGLDQDMMQKNLSMATIGDAQKNMATFSIVLVFANALFIALGALLYIYASNVGLPIPASADQLYPTVALQYLSPATGIIFIVGLIAAAYSSADSALTALTTSFCVDFLDFGRDNRDETERRRIRLWVHIGFSLVLLVVILAFRYLTDESVIILLFKAAGYTYGPLLGLFAFGLFTDLRVREWIPLGKLQLPAVALVCLLSPIISFLVDYFSRQLLFGFEFGFLILAFNGLLTFLGLLALSYREYDGMEEVDLDRQDGI